MGCGKSTEKSTEQVAELPQESCAEKTTVVVPPQESGGENWVRSVESMRQPPFTEKASMKAWKLALMVA